MYVRKDSFYKKAKQGGQRSRAAFKLEELADRYRLLRPGDVVVDLGAWPGSWLQVAAQRVGSRGRVVGVDLLPIDPLPGVRNVTTIQGDISAPSTLDQIAAACDGVADIILCDMAPKLTGIRDHDVANIQGLAERALLVATQLLRCGGTLMIKVFMSDELPGYLRRLRDIFDDVRTTRPEATRRGSAEVYAIATGHAGPKHTP